MRIWAFGPLLPICIMGLIALRCPQGCMRVVHESSGGAQLLWCLVPGQCLRQPDTTERHTNTLHCITRLALNGVTKSRCQDAPGRLAKLHSLRDACSLVRAWVTLSYCLAQEVPRCGTGLGCKSRSCLSGPQFPMGTALLIPLLFSCTLAGLSVWIVTSLGQGSSLPVSVQHPA